MESNYKNSERNYEKTSKRCCGGIKLNPRRFCVQRLRTNFMNIVRVLRRWKNYYKNGVRKLITRNLGTRKKERIDDVEFVYYNYYYYSKNNNNNNKRRVAIMEHSNSFSSEAIADCLEFIKRNSVSVDDDTNPMLIQHN
ncbi:hypothetical protein ABFX02_08G212600 [Erythranthe guttata]